MNLPRFTFLVGSPPRALTPDDDQWRLPLPRDRHAQSGPTSLPRQEDTTYGDYFEAAADFLLADEGAVLARAAGGILDRPIVRQAIERIDVHLVKHGAFYHPALVVWHLDGIELRMVLNVAVSPAGRTTLAGEYRALQTLESGFGRGFVPKVFACGQGRGRSAKTPLEMFAGQWMSGFHEAHLTQNSRTGRPQWVVWHDRRGPLHLTDRQIFQFHHQAAFILSRCYNPFTLEAILDWHHAAGDFVVNPDVDPLQVRLITVRRYAPVFDLDKTQPLTLPTLMEALVAFLIRTSLWMRIDRLDGVGDLTWAQAPDLLEAFLEGFLSGIAHVARLHGLPEDFDAIVVNYLAAHPADALRRVSEAIIARQIPRKAESRLIQEHLDAHIAMLSALLVRRRPVT